MANISSVIRLTQQQYQTLISTGSVSGNGTTINYDQNTLYVVDAPCSQSGYYLHDITINGSYFVSSVETTATIRLTFYSSINFPILSVWNLMKIPVALETIGYISESLSTAYIAFVKLYSLEYNSSTLSYDFKVFIQDGNNSGVEPIIFYLNGSNPISDTVTAI